MNMQKQTVDISFDSCEDHSPINIVKSYVLNNDCLMHIFQYLPIVDKIRIERVCKRWHLMSHNSWYHMKTLNFDNELWGFRVPKSIEKLNIGILKKILNRCGQYITEIEFSISNKCLGPNVLSVVSKFCPKIQHIYATDIDVDPLSIKVLAINCNKIISFAMGGSIGNCDNELSLLFEKNKRLKVLNICSNFKITGKCLSQLNSESIETIILENCPCISLKYFNIIKNCRHLKALMLEHFHDSDNKIMEVISLCSESLKILTLALCPYSNSLCQIAKLTNLEFLDLSSNISVDDHVLAAIGINCKHLKNVNISSCSAVTNVGLSHIVSLPKLKYLYIQDLDQITDGVFNSMPNLKDMDCSYCFNVRNAGLAKLIESSEMIENLYLYSCINISKELLEIAIRVTKKRKNNIVLKMHLSHTNIQLGEISDTSPFLRVVPMIVLSTEDSITFNY